MVNFTGLLKGVTKLIEESKIPVRKETIKYLTRQSILPGEHPTISDLKRRLIGARVVAVQSGKLASANSRFSPKGMQEIKNQIKKAKDFYLTPEWKGRAMKYAGMTDKEADATAKFLSSNISRYGISSRPLIPGPTHGVTIHDGMKVGDKVLPATGVGGIRTSVAGIFDKTPIHEAHHAAMLGNGAFIPSQLGVTDPNVISGMNKFNRHVRSLGQELAKGLELKPKISQKSLQYLLRPEEIRSRMLTGLTEGYTPSEIPGSIDGFKRFVNPDVYANVAKKMLVAAPISIGLKNYMNND